MRVEILNPEVQGLASLSRAERQLPRHVAIIMDGNGRWARQRGHPRSFGHEAGVAAVRRAIRAALDIGVEALTLFAFSTENWRRPAGEVEFLWHLLQRHLQDDLPELHALGVRVMILGERQDLPQAVQRAIAAAEEVTAGNDRLFCAFAVNYGGRRDITRVARELAEEVRRGRLRPEDISEDLLEKRLATAPLPSLDLLIRTGGEMRVSNFLLWELAYAEFVSLPVLWPDFEAGHMSQAIQEYQKRHRRFGGVGP
ncbi:MAG: polyprenyl diphosphate synthase [Bacillota bacterium]|nr:polyprenyl diphosphate synthase [Bacillota bacterium]